MTAIVTSKSTSVRLGSLSLLACGFGMHFAYAAPQHRDHPSSSLFPVACYFLESGPQKHPYRTNELNSQKIRAYEATSIEVHRLWCTRIEATPEAKEKAADAMANAWKLAWDEDEPYNAEFHETAGFELLVLLGITHHLPAPMIDNPKFTQMWVEDCSERCFTIWGVPEDASGEHGIAMEFRLRNDVLDNLKKEPASEPVLTMLQNAQYRLVD